MSRGGGFPPGLGAVPVVVAIAVAAVAASGTLVPQFATRTVGTTGGAAAAQAGSGDTGAAAGGPVTAGGTQAGTGGAAAGVAAAGGGAGGAGAVKGGAAQASIQCAAGRNGGSTAPGVTATEIHAASTIVTTGVGAGFLGEAVDGMQAAINEANAAGGVCGRRLTLDTVNSGWDQNAGQQDISNYINAGNVFALVGEPDSEGLKGAIESGTIDRAGMPVVGSDGMLADQYTDPWVFPVAASTVSNMHIVAEYAFAHGARTFGIVYDTHYKFGQEGATAFAAEVQRLGGTLQGAGGSGCAQAYCGISSTDSSYSSAITTFDSACSNAGGGGKPCDAVVMLLEPQPMEVWMKGEENAQSAWYSSLYGGEPLFDDNFASLCAGRCAHLTVWTGYHPALQPFDSEPAVAKYVQSLKSAFPNADAHNEFTEGAYLGTRLFIAACQAVGAQNKPLTRENLRAALTGTTFDLGLSAPLRFPALPHLANTSMAAFADNAPQGGSFNGWNYLATGFLADRSAGKDMRG
jgi:ABC-type branched-subunit amino acid transport system substrate-binding protein